MYAVTDDRSHPCHKAMKSLFGCLALSLTLFLLGWGCFKGQLAVIFVPVKAAHGQWGRAGQNRLGSFRAEVIPAKRKGPHVAGLWPAAGGREEGPGNLSLNRPASVDIARRIQGAVKRGHGRHPRRGLHGLLLK